jgi:DNA-binding transcriptional LysR family regulator
MDLDELRALVLVVETGSFLAAANALNLSRTTLRRRVDALEARAGVPLLLRASSGVRPTTAGEVLVHKGRQLMQEASALVASVRDIGDKPAGELRIVVPVGLPPHVLMPLLGSLRSRYPQLAVHLRVREDPVSGLLDDIDAALHFGEHAPVGPWLAYTLLTVREWLIASTDYLDRRGTPRTVGELAEHELLAWQAPGEDARAWPTLSGPHFAVEPRLITADIHFIRQCVIAGQGIGLVPDARVPDPGVEPGTLTPVLPDIVGRERHLRIVVPKVLARVPKIEALLDRMRAMMAARPKAG